MTDLLSLKKSCSPVEIYGSGGKITTATRSILKLSLCTSEFETLVEILIIPRVITDQPSLPIANELNNPEGLLLTDPDFRQPGSPDLNIGVGLYPRLMNF